MIAEIVPKYLDPDMVRVVNGDVPVVTKVILPVSVSIYILTSTGKASGVALGS